MLLRRLPLAVALFLLAGFVAASASNAINANARHLMPDGSWESDSIDTANPGAWFSFPIYAEHSYMIEALVPSNYNNFGALSTLDITAYEADGTTPVSGPNETTAHPSLDETNFQGGARKHLNNFLTDRFVHIVVQPCCGNGQPVTESFHVRVIDLTQTAARWTVNGYSMFIALNNTSRNAASGYVDYFDQAGNLVSFDFFSVPADGSIQLVHNANTPIGGVLFGGIRVIPSSGSPGAITAHEYNFNPAIGQYLSFPFNAAPWRYGTPAQ